MNARQLTICEGGLPWLRDTSASRLGLGTEYRSLPSMAPGYQLNTVPLYPLSKGARTEFVVKCAIFDIESVI